MISMYILFDRHGSAIHILMLLTIRQGLKTKWWEWFL